VNLLVDPAASISVTPKLTPLHSSIPDDYVFNLSKEQQDQYGPLNSVLEAGVRPVVQKIKQTVIDNQQTNRTRSSTGLLPKNTRANPERPLNEVSKKPMGVQRKRAILAQSRTRATKLEQQQQRYGVLRLLEKRIERGQVKYRVRWEDTWEPKSNIDQSLIREYEERRGSHG